VKDVRSKATENSEMKSTKKLESPVASEETAHSDESSADSDGSIASSSPVAADKAVDYSIQHRAGDLQ
jgi:hypothetical protein